MGTIARQSERPSRLPRENRKAIPSGPSTYRQERAALLLYAAKIVAVYLYARSPEVNPIVAGPIRAAARRLSEVRLFCFERPSQLALRLLPGRFTERHIAAAISRSSIVFCRPKIFDLKEHQAAKGVVAFTKSTALGAPCSPRLPFIRSWARTFHCRPCATS